MAKDWTGNSKSVFVTNGASNHAKNERVTNDFYATEPKAVDLLLAEESFSDNIWECACGAGHISKKLLDHGYNVRSTDLINRGYGDAGVDFLATTETWNGDIITNPPYSKAKEFVSHALSLIPKENKVAMFLKLTFLESQKRRKLFDKNPPKTIYVASARLNCARNADFSHYGSHGAQAYAWFVWEKGFKGDPVVRWIN